MKTLIATALVGLAIATSSIGHTRDLGREFREGWNPDGKNTESVEEILRKRTREGM